MEGETVGVQSLPMAAVPPVVPLAAVLAVPQQGMAHGGELGADLMGAAGDQLALHQGQAVPDGQGAVEGDGGLGPWNGLGADIDLLFTSSFQR